MVWYWYTLLQCANWYWYCGTLCITTTHVDTATVALCETHLNILYFKKSRQVCMCNCNTSTVIYLIYAEYKEAYIATKAV